MYPNGKTIIKLNFKIWTPTNPQIFVLFWEFWMMYFKNDVKLSKIRKKKLVLNMIFCKNYNINDEIYENQKMKNVIERVKLYPLHCDPSRPLSHVGAKPFSSCNLNLRYHFWKGTTEIRVNLSTSAFSVPRLVFLQAGGFSGQ